MTADSVGNVFRDAPAILVMATSGTNVTGNSISHGRYTGVSLGWGCACSRTDWNEVSHNTIEHTMTYLRDGGGIYISGSHGLLHNNTIGLQGATRIPDAPPWSSAFNLSIYNVSPRMAMPQPGFHQSITR